MTKFKPLSSKGESTVPRLSFTQVAGSNRCLGSWANQGGAHHCSLHWLQLNQVYDKVEHWACWPAGPETSKQRRGQETWAVLDRFEASKLRPICCALPTTSNSMTNCLLICKVEVETHFKAARFLCGSLLHTTELWSQSSCHSKINLLERYTMT